MKNFLLIASLALLTATAWAQNPPKPAKVAPNPSNLTQFGFSAAEAQAAQTDLKTWDQSNRDSDAQAQVFQAQRNQAMVANPPDRAAFEKLTRSIYELAVQKDLVRFDLTAKWRTTYGPEKAQTLEGIVRDASGGPGPRRP